MDYEDIVTYIEDPAKDGWGYSEYNENKDELSSLFEDTDINQYIDNLNDWD